jgi:hypothetical protein
LLDVKRIRKAQTHVDRWIRIQIRIRNTAFSTGSLVIGGEAVIGDLEDRWRGEMYGSGKYLKDRR